MTDLIERLRKMAKYGQFLATAGGAIDLTLTADRIEELERQSAELKTLAQKATWQSYELSGVIVDIEQGRGFDDICLNTIKRVRDVLGGLSSDMARQDIDIGMPIRSPEADKTQGEG